MPRLHFVRKDERHYTACPNSTTEIRLSEVMAQRVKRARNLSFAEFHGDTGCWLAYRHGGQELLAAYRSLTPGKRLQAMIDVEYDDDPEYNRDADDLRSWAMGAA